MKIQIIAAFTLAGASQSFAELSQMTEKPWEGVFAAFQNRDYQITVSAKGDINVRPVYAQGKIRDYVFIPVSWGIKLTDKRGARSELRVLPESLESKDTATDKLQKTTVTGKTEGGGSVELTISTDRKSVSFTVKLLDAGTLDAATAKAAIFSRVQNYYQREEDQFKNQPDKFQALVKDDWLKIQRTDKTKAKFDFIKRVVTASDEVTGPGVVSLETEIKMIKNTYTFNSGKGASMHLSNDRFIRKEGAGDSGVPLHKGYDITFIPDGAETGKQGGTIQIGIEK